MVLCEKPCRLMADCWPVRNLSEMPENKSFGAVLSDPFRPFFLLAGIQAAIVILLWLVMLTGHLGELSNLDMLSWHVHEMLFGYLAAVLAGFLFTAIPNWTGRLPLRGWPLGCLVLLWLCGRFIWFLPVQGWLAVTVDVSFLIAVAALAWREVLAGKNWRNAPICLLVTLLAASNLLFHLGPIRFRPNVPGSRRQR